MNIIILFVLHTQHRIFYLRNVVHTLYNIWKFPPFKPFDKSLYIFRVYTQYIEDVIYVLFII